MSLTAGGSGNDWFLLPWLAFMAYLFGSSIVDSIRRCRGSRRFAIGHNLAFTGDQLPTDLQIERTSLGHHGEISGCLWGDLRDIPLVIFTLSVRKAKATVSQTVVGFRKSGERGVPETPVDAVGSYQFEDAGKWVIGYVPRRKVDAEELEDWCVELHTLACDLLAEAKGDSSGRPRLFRWFT